MPYSSYNVSFSPLTHFPYNFLLPLFSSFISLIHWKCIPFLPSSTHYKLSSHYFLNFSNQQRFKSLEYLTPTLSYSHSYKVPVIKPLNCLSGFDHLYLQCISYKWICWNNSVFAWQFVLVCQKMQYCCSWYNEFSVNMHLCSMGFR